VLPDRSLTAVEARDMLEPTLTVLEYIHRQGFAHAHLKPSNIMAVEDRLKLSSDGIVRAGTKLGTDPAEHDPPERTASPAGDAWSLGVTLVEVLTQRLPLNGVVPPDLPEPFATIARGCLKKNPADRLTVPQISNLLSPAPAAVVPRKRRYTPIGVMILLAALVITVAGVMIMQSDTPATAAKQPVAAKVPTPEPQPAPPPPQEQPKALAKAVKAKPEPPPETKAPAPEPVAVVPVSGITSQPLPEITDKARNTIHGRVRFTVRVDVAPSGSVTDAKIDSSGASKYFSERALASVRQWKFEPVSVNGSEVGQRWRVRFEFLKSGTKVQPQRVSP
jgi:TonB family protein